MFYARLHRVLALLFVMSLLLACVPVAANHTAPISNQDNSQADVALTPATKNPDAQPVIWIGDFNNFDDAIALMLIAKDPRYRIDLIVVEESFNTVAHGANTAYNILEWLGNLETEIIRGSYYALEEVQFGANGANAAGTAVEDEHAVAGQPDYQLPNSLERTSEQWNLERRNVMGINLYAQYIPGPWRDNGATLYNTDHLIPRATQETYHYQGNRGAAFGFQLAETVILEELAQASQNVVILNTGKLTTLARVLAKGSAEELAKIDQTILMGGGFQGFDPFTADHKAACFGDKSLNLGGNIFSHPSFSCETDFSTDQEYNIFLDPASAQYAFDLLSAHAIKTFVIPTNSTDLAKVHLASIAALAEPGGTPESCYSSKLFAAIRDFEGGDFNGSGDFAMDAVIRLWDIIAALVLLEPQLIVNNLEAYVAVDQLDPGLSTSATPYDPLTFDPLVGKTTIRETGSGQKLNLVLGVDIDAARQAMINRLRDPLNAAHSGDHCDSAGQATAANADAENALMTIGAARSQPISSTVTVAGTVIVGAGDFSSSTFDQGFALQDATAGIYVSLADETGVKLGDQVEVTGELQAPNGLLTIVPATADAVQKQGEGEAITPEAVTTGAVNEATEGRLVVIEGKVSQAVVDDLPYGYKFYVDDGSGEIQVFVSASSNLDLSALQLDQSVRVVGFSGEYATTYEVQPRVQEDITVLD
jgi:inosine-uridine nucleoside N-ribohydrolase/uncharacterized protein YdeI (BOF family)